MKKDKLKKEFHYFVLTDYEREGKKASEGEHEKDLEIFSDEETKMKWY